MAKTNPRTKSRLRRKMHIRKTVRGTAARPRLSIFRSTKHIYAQIINDETVTTLVSASTQSGDIEIKGHKGNKAAAVEVGTAIAKKAIDAGIDTVTFDRNGFLYHGRVQALADAAREAGLKF